MNKVLKLSLSFVFLLALVSSLYFFTDWFSRTTGFSPPVEENVSVYCSGFCDSGNRSNSSVCLSDCLLSFTNVSLDN